MSQPKKPEGIDSKNAYIIGTGLAALSAACYLVRDAQMPGDHRTRSSDYRSLNEAACILPPRRLARTIRKPQRWKQIMPSVP